MRTCVLAFPGEGRWISRKLPRNFLERRMSRQQGGKAVAHKVMRIMHPFCCNSQHQQKKEATRERLIRQTPRVRLTPSLTREGLKRVRSAACVNHQQVRSFMRRYSVIGSVCTTRHHLPIPHFSKKLNYLSRIRQTFAVYYRHRKEKCFSCMGFGSCFT